MTNDAVSQIKAAQGIYRGSDVARAYGVHRSTITRIWAGSRHAGVSPANDFPDIQARPQTTDLAEDMRILLERGMNQEEVCKALDISRATYYHLKGVFI